jgi:putative transposase
MHEHQNEFRVCAMCRVLGVHRSGFYAWLQHPQSMRCKEDVRLLGLVKQAWLESGTVYGYRKVCADLRDLGETCSRHRIARLMKREGLRAQRGYGRRPGMRGGRPATGSQTSRTCAHTKAGSIWPSSSTCSHDRSWAGPCKEL